MLHIEKFNRILLPGEKLLWTGKPGTGLLLTKMDLMLIPFSLFWGGFAIFWEYQVLTKTQGKAPFFFVLWGIPFILIGVYMIVGRFFVDAYLRSKIFYAITDGRLLILREGVFGGVQAFQLSQLPAANFSGSPAGSGTLDFTDGSSFNRNFGAWTPALAKGARLLKIENAWAVFTLLQQAQRQSKTVGI
ncbi:PH domain-containing protein [Rhizobium sp. LjRoot254]|uniref:PH domain-containing protein n=1 Tax=Rhizobium sp. LjRoot254 TaxID=3342297 RepID=UPI003ECCCA10